MISIRDAIINFSDFIWGTPLLILLLGGGFFFLIYSRLAPLRYIGHSIKILAGKYNKSNEPGQISHYQALSTAIAATVGMGNISGVAVAIVTGGPGAIFWMWVSAFIGVSTKFFTCSLAIMYRGKDSSGQIEGGPMYVITEGLGKKWKPMATFFALMGMIGVAPLFQANQLTQAIRDIVLIPNNIPTSFTSNFITGIAIIGIMSLVIFGGIKRIGKVTGGLVPVMVILYILSILFILFSNTEKILPSFRLIFYDAFTGNAVLGGALGSLIVTGVRRAAFSNEAGIGTAPMAHGATKTGEPIREGLVAMLEPIIDTIIVCTMTALAIIITGVWETDSSNGITLTAAAFEKAIPIYGKYVLMLCVATFSLSTIIAFPYYGTKCFNFIFGTRYKNLYNIIYTLSVLLGATATLTFIISIIDSAYALMAFPTMISALLLSPKVRKAAKDYFRRLKAEG